MKTLKIADGLALPVSFATKTAAILAQRRKGKTYAASVIAEEMVAAKQPFVALDPTGAWWGLRASADGTSEGLPVVILGGQHGDVQLERTAGRLIADLVVDEPGYYVIDFSLFESGEAERQFAVDFAERLYRAKGQPGKDFTLHLFVDEADRFIPQQMRKGSTETSPRLLGAFEAIVRRGGLRGLGTTLISQRAAVVNKNVLEMLDVLIALRTVGPNDRKAVEGYIKAHGTDDERAAMMGSIASLGIGEAWVWEPGAEPALFTRVQIRQRRTFNSSATPEPGKNRAEPRRLAAVDLAALNQRMAETIEKAKQDDPRELRKRIGDKDKRIKELEKVTSGFAPSNEGKKTEVEILTDADRETLAKVSHRLACIRAELDAESEALIAVFTEKIDKAVGVILKRFHEDAATIHLSGRQEFEALLERAGFKRILEKLDRVQVPPTQVTIHPQHGVKPATRAALVDVARTAARSGGLVSKPATKVGQGTVDGQIDPAQQKILDVIRMFGERGVASNLDSLSAWLDLHQNGGRFRGNLRELRVQGYLFDYELTAQGLAAAREIPSGLDAAKTVLSGGEIAIVEVLEGEPVSLSVEDIASRLNLHPNGGRFRGSLRRLKDMALVTPGPYRLTEAARR